MEINFSTAKKKLATLWFIMAAVIFTLMILMSFSKLKGFLDVAWGWLLPNLLPTLSLILAVFFIDIQSKVTDNTKTVDRFYFRIAFYISTFYLLLILGIILSTGFGFKIHETIKGSNFYLGPIQGIVGAALALFFYKKE